MSNYTERACGALVLRLITTAACTFTAATAFAAPAKNTWTTYLYQGPGYHFSVVDELPQASDFDLAGCSDGWCKITFGGRIGYLRADVVTTGDLAHPPAGVLAQPAALVSPAPPAGPCFEANQTGGNGGNAPTRFCGR